VTSAPVFTAIAKFIRALGEQVSLVFTQVTLARERQCLIVRKMFAIEGAKTSAPGLSRRCKARFRQVSRHSRLR
jgi:hypothetical protein